MNLLQERPTRSQPPTVGGRLRALPWLQIAGGALVAVVLVAVVPPFRRAAATIASKAILLAAAPFTPSISAVGELPQASKVLAADGSPLGQLGGESRQPVALDQLPDDVTHAVLAAEDANFYSHSGVDPGAVFRALLNNVRGKPTQGGSTITEQLAKLNYGGSKRTTFRKLKEVLYASKLERTYSKNELLERYLNQVYFGRGAYGIGAASQTFFGVAPEKLSAAQAATLAGKIRAPNELDPWRNADAVVTRRNQVLEGMRRHGWLSPDQLAPAQAAPLAPGPERPSVGLGSKAPHFLAYVGREAARLDALGGTPESRGKQVFTGGYTIESTLDPKAFDAATAAVRGLLGAPGDPVTAIASVQPGDGAIRVLFGGLDPNLEFDVASQGRRQPGSSFKPYVYLAMLKAGVDPRTTFDSGTPQTLNCGGAPWTVRNYEGSGGGPISVDAAMTDSVNTVFAQVMAQIGPDAVAQAAERAGISHDALTPPRCALALGGLDKGVTPLEQAAGFATFAAKGVYAAPYSITRITDRDGKVVYQRAAKATPSVDAKQVGVLNAALKTVVERGTGTAAAIGRPVAGKTGTTENYGNAWFIGYVPQLSTAVWVGRPEGDVPMTNVHGVRVTGGSFPARIFSRYMGPALAGTPVQDLFTASPDDLSLRSAKTQVTPPPPSVATPQTPSTSADPVDTPTVPQTTLPREPIRPAVTIPVTSTTKPSATTSVPATTSTTSPKPASALSRGSPGPPA
jgi:penicillin-binding protein 1A